MMIDHVSILIKSGHGGRGMVRFLREKYRPRGGPDGGDGGDGGSIYLEANEGRNTLDSFQGRKQFQAQAGGDGGGVNRHGKTGEDLRIAVPVGTLVWRIGGSDGDKVLLVDLQYPGQKVVVARGGRGGYGNAHFATSRNQTPLLAEVGESGERIALSLELRLLADVGIVGLPNAGKSTLLNAISGAKAKVGAYPFTTTEPVLGVASLEENRFVVVEVPGLIEGAHTGVGLGHQFLRHAQRTKLLVYLLDGTSPSPAQDYVLLRRELQLFDPSLGEREHLIALNKIDLPDVREGIADLQALWSAGMPKGLCLSAATGEGLEDFLRLVGNSLGDLQGRTQVQERSFQLAAPQQAEPHREVAEVVRQDKAFVVKHSRAERLAAGTDLSRWEAQVQFRGHLTRLGITRALEEAGIRPGDAVWFGDIEVEW